MFALAGGGDVASDAGNPVEMLLHAVFEKARCLVDPAEFADRRVRLVQLGQGDGKRLADGVCNTLVSWIRREGQDCFPGTGFSHGGEGECPAREVLPEERFDQGRIRIGLCRDNGLGGERAVTSENNESGENFRKTFHGEGL